MNAMFENEQLLDGLLIQERKRRIKCEGPPTEPLRIITEHNREKLKFSANTSFING